MTRKRQLRLQQGDDAKLRHDWRSYFFCPFDAARAEVYLSTMRIRVFAIITSILCVWLTPLTAFADPSTAPANLLKNGNFADGDKHWSDFGASEAKDVCVVEIGGRKAAKLERKLDKAVVAISTGQLALKPQTLYRLQATAWGTTQANLRIRLANSKDPEFGKR